MRAWQAPDLGAFAQLPGRSAAPLIFNSATGALNPAEPVDSVAKLYVCGITPYDATHLGHAATYIAFDTLQRVWRDAGFRVEYAQNATDVDDPLLERAKATGVDWQELAADQLDLFRRDMELLSVIPPDSYVAVTEVIDQLAQAVAELERRGFAYRVSASDASKNSDGTDVYFDSRAAGEASPWALGSESRLRRVDMLPLFAERGGDPNRPGKRDRLDPLLWRAARDDEPAWESALGAGRPGWHIECAVIALTELGHLNPVAGFGAPATATTGAVGTSAGDATNGSAAFAATSSSHVTPIVTVQGGGSDLLFPHHEFSAGHVAALAGQPLAQVYAHSGMVAYQGEKMSKSLGNLVLVSRLREQGVDPRVIRLAVLAHHYRSDWEWDDSVLQQATERLLLWSRAAENTSRATVGGEASSWQGELPASFSKVNPATVASASTAASRTPSTELEELRGALHLDLDTPRALAVIDEAARRGTLDTQLCAAADALLGICLD